MSGELDLENICRVCLRDFKGLKLLYETGWVNQTFAEILIEVTRHKVSPSDELPQKICRSCRKSAIDAIKFKRKCEQSYCHLTKQRYSSLEFYDFKKASQKHQAEKYTQTDACTLSISDKSNILEGIFKEQKGDENGKCSTNKSFNQSDIFEICYQSGSICSICESQCTNEEDLRRHLVLFHKCVEFDSGDIPNVKQKSTNLFKVDTNMFGMCNDSGNEPMQEFGLLEFTNHFEDGEAYKGDDKPVTTFQRSRNTENFCVENRIEQVFIDECSGGSKLCIQKINDIKDLTEIKPIEKDVLSNQTKKEEHFFPCTLCSKVFKSSPLLRKHMTNRHDSHEKISCHLCNKSFKQSQEYQKHLENKHNEKANKCSICDKTFSTKVYLQRHIAIHEKKRYICKECSLCCVTKEELTAHVKAEGHDKPLLCPECGLRCKTSNILMIHMRRHKGEKPFKCKFCSKGFPRMDDLRIHEKYHTGEKSHFCETCGKGFQRKYNLTIHLRVHSGERPYKCPHCSQAFAQGNDLKAHIRRHTGERFRCEHCGAPFLQGYQMRQHKLSEHGIREIPPTQRVAKFTSSEAQEFQIKQNLQKQSTQTLDTKILDNSINLELNSFTSGTNKIQEDYILNSQ